MENIKIENTWDSDNVHIECKCDWPRYRTSCNPTITSCNCPSDRKTDNILESISCGSRLFTNTLYAIKYPNLIITNTGNYKTVQGELQVSHLNIFDTIQNKIIFSSKNDLSEANQELIKRIKLNNPHLGVVNDIFQYDSNMMMEHFMIIKLKSSYPERAYIVFNFKTHTYKIFMFCDLRVCLNRLLFVFVTVSNAAQKPNYIPLYNYKIITKYDIDNNINNIMEIDKQERGEINCMCNSNIFTYTLNKIVPFSHSYAYLYVYYDIKKQKCVYTSKNEFVGWRGDKLIEYDSELKKCNLISFTAINIPKKFINCNRCLDKFEESSEEIIPEHKNICSLCIIKL